MYTSSAVSLLVNQVGGVSGFTRSLEALDKAKTVPVTPESCGDFNSWLARRAHMTPPQKEAALRLHSNSAHTLHVHGRQATWRARAEFSINKLGCNAVACVNDRPSALFRCPVARDTSTVAFKGAQLCLNCVAKDKDPYLHALFTDCKSFDVEPGLNERALPPVIQHAYTQTEAAPPVADDL